MRLFVFLLSLLVVSFVWGKSGRTFYSAQKLAAAQEKIQKYDWAQASVVGAEASAARWIALSDQELWDFIPPPEQLRALNVSFGVGCPVHGAEVFRKGGHYPWIVSSDQPFKVKCPVGGEVYPGNDFEPWNLKSLTEKPQQGPGYKDTGAGWVDDKGRRYYFVAYHIFWHRWQKEVLPAVNHLAQAYLLTGKPVYAHKCAVMLAKIGGDWSRFDYPTQAYHNGRWPAGIGGRILDYIWSTGTITNLSKAYDAVYPALEEPELATFLKAKEIADPRLHIEQRMLRVMAEDIMRGFVKGNAGMHQQALATLAIVWGNEDPGAGPTKQQMADWIMTGDGDSEFLLWNGFYRDGHGGESSPGYSSGWVSNYYQVARLLPELGLDIWSNPKLKKMADIGLDLTIAGIAAPSIGDSGSILGGGKVGWAPSIQGPAFEHYGDPRFAQALQSMGAQAESLWESEFDPEEVAAAVAKAGPEIDFQTRNLGGYGLAILESGSGKTRRGVSMYYGHAGGGHGQRDRLTIEMLDGRFRHPVLNDMGYPAHWLTKNTYWTGNTISHYAVVVNQGWQQTMYAGYLNTLAAAPGLQLMDASAEKVAYPSAASTYRRSVALIDISPEASYLLDVFRVKGGWQHDYSFHGPAFPEFTVQGGSPGPVQATGTLAGEDVPFAGTPKPRAGGAGTALALRDGEGVLHDNRPYDVRSLEGWSTYHSGPDALSRKVGAVMSVKVAVAPGKYKVFLRAYDYNAGTNAVDVTIGEQTQSFRWEPSGQVGYRWLSQVFEIAKPAEKVTLNVREQGQNYVLLEGITLVTDLEAVEPRVWDPSTSGFQYLFNVRRMKPQGAWAATWRDPVQDLGLSLKVPAGVAQEVILADAEPELKPGHPETLQYVLARNESQSDDLESTFVAVAEAHQGPAQLGAVERLVSTAALEGTIGLQVALPQGRHLIHSSTRPGEQVAWQGAQQPLVATAEFALVALDREGVKSAYVVNGTELKYGSFGLTIGPPPQGTVAGVDFGGNSITIEGTLKAAEQLVGRVLIGSNERHQTSYTIHSAKSAGGQTKLGFGDTLFVVGMGRVTGVDQKAGTLTTDTQLTGYGRVDGGQHAGRWLYNEDRTRGFRIASLGGMVFKLEGVDGELEAIYTDADGDGLRRFWISDFGPGDLYRVPTVTQVERTAQGSYRVRMMTDVVLTVEDKQGPN